MTLLEKALGIFCAVLVLALGITGWRLRRAQAHAGQIALRADTLEASLDSSRHVALSRRDSVKILGDTLQAVTRRVVQVGQRNDALDRAQQLDRIALANLSAEVRSLGVRLSSSGPVRTDTVTGARSAVFAVEQPPYHGTAGVSLPVSGPGTLDLSIRLDRASIGLRLGCGEARDGVRSATATATGPPWLALELGRIEQEPGLCRSPALEPSRPGLFRRLVSRCGVSGGYGFVVSAGAVRVGPAAIAGCRVFP